MIPFRKLAEWFTGGDVKILLDRTVGAGTGNLVTAMVSLLLAFLFARWLYRRKIFVRA